MYEDSALDILSGSIQAIDPYGPLCFIDTLYENNILITHSEEVNGNPYLIGTLDLRFINREDIGDTLKVREGRFVINRNN